MPVERGCGTKKAGGMYLEVGTSPNGFPIEWFLYDPPKAPEELGLPRTLSEELANKTRTVQVGDVQHVLRWVGAQSYPYVGDIIEEGRRHGLSFRIPPDFPVETLTPIASSILLAHPFCYNDEWEEQNIPKWAY